MVRSIMRVEIGSKVSDMSSKELRRDLLLYAKKNPKGGMLMKHPTNPVFQVIRR